MRKRQATEIIYICREIFSPDQNFHSQNLASPLAKTNNLAILTDLANV